MVKASDSVWKNSVLAIINHISAKIMGPALLMMNHLIKDPNAFARYILNFWSKIMQSYLFWNNLDWMGRSFMWKENRALAKFICTSSDSWFLYFLFNWFFHLKMPIYIFAKYCSRWLPYNKISFHNFVFRSSTPKDSTIDSTRSMSVCVCITDSVDKCLAVLTVFQRQNYW